MSMAYVAIPYCHGNRCNNHEHNNTHQLSLGSQQWNGYHTALLAPVESSHPAGNDEDTYTV